MEKGQVFCWTFNKPLIFDTVLGIRVYYNMMAINGKLSKSEHFRTGVPQSISETWH